MTLAFIIIGAWVVVGVVLSLVLGSAFALCEARGARAVPQRLRTPSSWADLTNDLPIDIAA